VGERIGVYRILVGKPGKKGPLSRPRLRWEDYNKMDLQQVGCGVVNWIELAHDRDRWRELVNVVMNLRVSQNAGNFLSSLASQEGLCSTVYTSKKVKAILHVGTLRCVYPILDQIVLLFASVVLLIVFSIV
jgi:hypothetical protein